MKERNISNFIFSSSCTVYGQADKMPIDENTPLKLPESSYGKTKQMGEEILKDFATAHQKKVTLLRYFNPIGAHPSAKLGELPIGIPNNLVSLCNANCSSEFVRNFRFGEMIILLKMETAIRDYIYVVDFAKAHVKALQKLISKTSETLDRYL